MGVLAEDALLNVTGRLTAVALAMPDAIAVVEPLGYDRDGKRRYRHITFRELDDDSSRIAAGLQALGVMPGTQLALLVRPGIDFLSLVVALLKAAAVIVLIDPGMGRGNLIRCLAGDDALVQCASGVVDIRVAVGFRWHPHDPDEPQLR